MSFLRLVRASVAAIALIFKVLHAKLGGIYLWGRRTPYIFPHLLRADPLFKIKDNQVFDHNFARSARIELRFWEVANLEKLNNFCHDHF